MEDPLKASILHDVNMKPTRIDKAVMTRLFFILHSLYTHTLREVNKKTAMINTAV